jgi:branched-chain amino acid transport system permease protein
MGISNTSESDTTLGERIDDRLATAPKTLLVGAVLVLLAGLLALPQFVNDYYVQVLFIIFLFITLAFGWNTLSGFTGYVNFGYAGFVGLGAYVTVLSVVDLGLPWYAALLFAGLATGLFGTLISAPILRLDGAYFAIAMLSLATAGQLLVSSEYLSPITRGGTGISFFPALDYTQQYYLVVGLAFAAGYITYRLATSPLGLRLLAIREDELLASALGVKTTREKLVAMAIHATIGGIAGGVLAFNLSYIDPATVFALRYTELPIVMVLFGTPGSVLGPIVGGIAFILVSEALWASFPTLHQFFFGLAIMAVVMFLPRGLVERLKDNDLLPRRRSL